MTKRQAENYTAVVDQSIIDYCDILEKIDPDVCFNTLSDLFRNVCEMPDDMALFDRIHDGYNCMLTPGNQFLKLMEDNYCQGKTDPQCGLKLFKHCTGVYVVRDEIQFSDNEWARDCYQERLTTIN